VKVSKSSLTVFFLEERSSSVLLPHHICMDTIPIKNSDSMLNPDQESNFFCLVKSFILAFPPFPFFPYKVYEYAFWSSLFCLEMPWQRLR